MPLSSAILRPHPHLYEINTWVWLNTLSRKAKRRIRLGDVPNTEWDDLQAKGFDSIWLMGLWERSARSQQIARNHPDLRREYDLALPGWQESDVGGSPFAVRAYRPAPEIASWEELGDVLGRLHARGMKLVLDFVPNHTALDHEWVTQHPEYYVQGTFQDAIDFSTAFFPVETLQGLRFIAHGKDPHFPAWTDTAQLHYFNLNTRTALLRELHDIAQYCDGFRCDMAILVLNQVFRQTWGKHLQSLPLPSLEFWTEATVGLPDWLWIAEVYGNREWELQQLGFHFTYDKTLYDRLRCAPPQEIARHLHVDVSFQNKLVRFLENHDEERSAVIFKKSRLPTVIVLMATVPGMRLYHQGQLTGTRLRIPVQLGRVQDESPDEMIVSFYDRILTITNEDVFHLGQWTLLTITSAGDESFNSVIAYEWKTTQDWRLIILNLSALGAQGVIEVKGETVNETFHGTDYAFVDLLTSQRFEHRQEDLRYHGLSVRLDPLECHVFSISPSGEGHSGKS
ncbi:MAG: alpha-amylase family glycosyl hydrolase [Nitrospirales bacterium]